MFDIGWTEMLVVAVVAIIVVGPKDLPGMLRTVGKTVKKLRGMAGDFQRQFDDALKEAELDGVKNSIENVKSMNPLNDIKDSLNPLKDAAKDIEDEINDDGESDPGQEDDGEYSSFDPGDLFDESKLVKVSEPVKVDVEKALAKEKAKAAKRVSTKPSNATTKPKTAKKPASAKPAGKKAAGSKSAPKKSAPKKPTKKPAARTTTRSEVKKPAKAQSA